MSSVPPKPDDYKISTMTYITKIDYEDKTPFSINLDLFSRFMTINEIDENIKGEETREGCFIGLKSSSSISVGVEKNNIYKIKIPKKKSNNIFKNYYVKETKMKDFNNQVTLIYKYWGCREVNIKLFNNGKIQLSGIQNEDETYFITNKLIDKILSADIKIQNKVVFDAGINFIIVKTQDFNYYYNNEYFDNYVKLLNDKVSDGVNKFIKLYKTTNIDDNVITKWINLLEEELNRMIIKYNIETDKYNLIDELSTFKNIQRKNMKKMLIDIKLLNRYILKILNIQAIDREICLKFETGEYKYRDDDGKIILCDNKKIKISYCNLEMLNCNYNINFNIKNNVLYKLFRKNKIFVEYEPDNYPGLKLYYYWNKNDRHNPVCSCEENCARTYKKDKCANITFLIFQTGSIVITNCKSYQQADDCYNYINKFLTDNYDNINSNIIVSNTNKTLKNYNNKKNIHYIKKSNIINFDDINLYD